MQLLLCLASSERYIFLCIMYLCVLLLPLPFRSLFLFSFPHTAFGGGVHGEFKKNPQLLLHIFTYASAETVFLGAQAAAMRMK